MNRLVDSVGSTNSVSHAYFGMSSFFRVVEVSVR